jgi:hypothetical protein
MRPSLQTNDTSIQVTLCDWHLRRIFWNEDFWGKYRSGEFYPEWGPIVERKKPLVNVPSAKYNQEFKLIDRESGEEVVRCHWFLQADKKTVCASGHPDPKEINWKGFNYHQKGKSTPDCEHCDAGITTYPDNPVV